MSPAQWCKYNTQVGNAEQCTGIHSSIVSYLGTTNKAHSYPYVHMLQLYRDASKLNLCLCVYVHLINYYYCHPIAPVTLYHTIILFVFVLNA